MAGTQVQAPEEKGAKQRRRPIAGIIALAALAVAAAAWFWVTRQPAQPEAGIGLPDMPSSWWAPAHSLRRSSPRSAP